MLEALPNSWVEKIQQVSIRGTPDFLMCLSGVFVAIELKVGDGKLDKLQDYKLQQIAACGGIAMVLTPENLDEMYSFLEQIALEGEDISEKTYFN